MKLDMRQRLLSTTLLVGASMLASPAFAQTPAGTVPATPPTCPPGTPPNTAGCNNADNSATPSTAETTAPLAGQTTIPSTNAQGANVRSEQDIVITGTRIPQPNLTSASPVTVLSSQELKLQGTTRTEDLINSLPQSFAAQGSNVSNGATGIATVNLRGIGEKRTAVLINGRRMQPGDPREPAADLNFIPAALVKRVDVLTGGASSVYGADAVAGVVNFIMDTNFKGLRIDAQGSAFWHHQHTGSDVIAANTARHFRPPTGDSINGGAQDISVAFGTSFADNRGSILAYATYRNQDPVLQATRDYSFCGFTATKAGAANKFSCGGSGTSNIASILSNAGTFHVTGTTPANQDLAPGTVPFNFGPYNYYQRPDERYTLGTFAEYEISPGAKPYLEAMFMNDTSTAAVAPSGDFFDTSSIQCDNPLLSAAQRTTLCHAAVYDPTDATRTKNFQSDFGNLVGQQPIFDPVTKGLLGFTAPTDFPNVYDSGTHQAAIGYIGRRNVEGGPRLDYQEHTSWRIVAGMRGDLLRGLSYDAYYQYGTTHELHRGTGYFSTRRLGQAIDAVTDPNDPTSVICRGSLNGTADAGCVPYNPFSTAPNAVNAAQLNFLQIPGSDAGTVSENVANANVTLEGGEYGLQTPWSDRGLGVNVGAEYRKESLTFDPDATELAGDLAGSGGPATPVHGNFDVRELFGEVQLPIVSHSFIEDFTLTGGYRYSDYKVLGNHFSTNTYKISAELAPVHDIRFRAGYNRAVRAPNINELFSPQSAGLFGGTEDPCATSTPTASLAQCQLTGVSAAQYGRVPADPAGQYNSLAGGNPNVAPEKADTYTFGAVLQPRFIPGLAITADYFNIRVKGLIGTIGYNTIMDQCLKTGDSFFCSRIHRATGNGNLFIPVTDLATGGYIVDLNTNVGGLRTKGIDINGSYARKFGHLGTMNVSFVGTYLQHLDVNPLGDIVYNCAGFYGVQCGTPNPKWRHKLRVGFTLPSGIGLSAQWRYFAKVRDDTLSSDPDLASAVPVRPLDARLNARSYFDLALTARVGDRYNLRLGVNNLLDKDPPLASTNASGSYPPRSSPPFGNGNTFPQVYDSLGRYMFAGVTIDF